MSFSLSPVQAEVLSFYKSFMTQNKRAPSIRDVAKALNRDASNIHYHLKKLEKMGLLVRTGGYRGVRLVNKESKLVPLLGTVACGEPIALLEEVEDYVEVPSNMLIAGYGYYALRASGESMIKAGIKNSDILLIRRQPDVQDGDIAVVVIDESDIETVTLKRVFHKTVGVFLKPENDNLEPYLIKGGEVRGKLVGVIRNLL